MRKRQGRVRLRLFAVLIWLVASPAFANDWDALEAPGSIAIMRHALAPGVGDPAIFTLGDCSTQRNLDARGRAQAERLGAAFRERGIRFEAILSSQWCRSMETATLMDLGPVEPFVALNSFFRGRGDAQAQTQDVRARLRENDARLLLVTHAVNIRALTGAGARSGEVLVIRPDDSGNWEVAGRILIAP